MPLRTVGQRGGGARSPRLAIVLFACCLFVGLLAPTSSAHGQRLGFRSNNSNSQQQVAQQIPWQQIAPEMVAKMRPIVERPTLYRHMPDQTIRCDDNLFVFLVRYPEVIVNMWQIMGVTKCDVRRVEDYVIEASDGAGTTSRVELVYGTRNLHVMYAEGGYAGPLFRRQIRGRCVLVLSSDYGVSDQKDELVKGKLDVFLQIDNAGAELVARTLHPLLGRTADTNFEKSAQFVEQVSDVAVKNASGMQRLAEKLTSVSPAVRNDFARIAASVAQPPASATVSLSDAEATSQSTRQ